MSPEKRSELLQGTLDMLILKVLALEPMHGWGVSERIQQLSRDVFHVNQGSVYPALQRLRRKGLITAEWQRSENNRRARYYALTRTGEAQLEREVEAWDRAAGAVERILRAASAPGG